MPCPDYRHRNRYGGVGGTWRWELTFLWLVSLAIPIRGLTGLHLGGQERDGMSLKRKRE